MVLNLLLHVLPGRPRLACIRSPSSVPVFVCCKLRNNSGVFISSKLQLTQPHTVDVVYYQTKHTGTKQPSLEERGEPKASAASIPASIATLHIGFWFLRPLKLARALADPVSGQSFQSRLSICVQGKAGDAPSKPPRVLGWGMGKGARR